MLVNGNYRVISLNCLFCGVVADHQKPYALTGEHEFWGFQVRGLATYDVCFPQKRT